MELTSNNSKSEVLEILEAKEEKSNELSKSKVGDDSIKINLDINPQINEYYISQENWKSSGFLSAEQWNEPINIQSQVIKIDKKTVTCNCAIDLSQNIFQTRIFPTLLFEHIEKIKPGDVVLVVIKEKKGSSRIDIIDGKYGVVDTSIFEKKNRWEKLKNSGFNKSIEGGIEL